MNARAAAPLLALALTLAAVAAPMAAAETIPLPADAATGQAQNSQIYQVACPAAGDCVAVGYYNDTSANHQALIEDERDGAWSAGEVPDSSLPSTDASPPQPELTSVACTSAANCVATDAFDEAISDDEQGLIDAETSGTWNPIVAPLGGLSSGVAANAGVEVTPVACPVAGGCVAVGNYTDAGQQLEGLIETQSASGWAPSEMPAPQGVSSASFRPGFYDLACAAAASCAAVGLFGPDNDQQGLLETDSNGTWSPTVVDLSQMDPAAAANPTALVPAVSCPGAGDCTAVGIFEDIDGAYEAFAVSEDGGTWQAPTALSLPADASTTPDASADPIQNDLYLNGISCASVGNCTAVGSYDAGGDNDIDAFTVTETGGSWGRGVATALPGGNSAPAANPEAMLDSVTCRAPDDCLAAGTYVAAAGDNVVLVARQSDAGWTTFGEELSSVYDANPSAPASPYWSSVSCVPGGYCAIGGNVADDATGNEDAFLLDAPTAPGTPTAALAGTEATVGWSAPQDDGGLPIVGYSVSANDLTDSARGGQSVQAGASDAAATIAGLTAGDSYTFTVTAQSLLGSGVPATSAAVGPPPGSPPSPPSVPATTPSITAPSSALMPTSAPIPTITTMPASALSRVRIYDSLEVLLAPTGSRARPPKLIRARGFTFTYRALEAGRVSVRWYQRSGHRKRPHRKLVGSGWGTAREAGNVRLAVDLTPLGRRLVAAGHRFRLTAVVSFSGGGLTVTRTHAFTLR